MPVLIHGKAYVTVAERIEAINKEYPQGYSLTSEILAYDPVLVKATLTIHTEKGDRLFTGHSAANPAKSIEKASPYEVAESSAWGRALAAAGFGTEEGIATADEMQKPAYGGTAPVAQMITPPQMKKIAVMMPQTGKYANIADYEQKTNTKVSTFTKTQASELIAKLEDASMAKVVADNRIETEQEPDIDIQTLGV